jgi:hypothetical protein
MQTGGSCSKPCSRSMRVPTEAPQAEAGQIGTARSLIAHPRGRAGDQLRCTRRSRPVQAAPARCAFRSVRRQPSSPATTRHAATAGRALSQPGDGPLCGRYVRPGHEAKLVLRHRPVGRRTGRPPGPSEGSADHSGAPRRGSALGRATALSSGTRRPRQGTQPQRTVALRFGHGNSGSCASHFFQAAPSLVVAPSWRRGTCSPGLFAAINPTSATRAPASRAHPPGKTAHASSILCASVDCGAAPARRREHAERAGGAPCDVVLGHGA